MMKMMRALFIACLLLFPFSYNLNAQTRTELFVTVTDDTWNVAHPVQKGETVFMLSRRYHVPPAILADANGLSYQDRLKENSIVTIPLGAYNLQTSKPANSNEVRALYYKVKPEDNFYRISRHAGVPQRTLASWNNLKENEVTPGQKLLVGWVLYDATQMIAVSPTTVTTVVPKTPVAVRPSATIPPVTTVVVPRAPVNVPSAITPRPLDTPHNIASSLESTAVDTSLMPQAPPVATLQDLFEEQTLQGQNLVWEKGSAAFFSMTTQAKGASVFAFHNKAQKGSVIRVKNMNNGKIVYVKVLGPIPLTKQYYNSIIGLSGSAKAALGVRDEKAFCELSYAGY